MGEPSLIELHGRESKETLLDIPTVHPSDGMHHELQVFADQVDAAAIDPRWKNVTLTTRGIMDEQLALAEVTGNYERGNEGPRA